ncbi:MAG: hypothetical protein RLZZ28_2207 [Bacteroidota bacterium]
MKNILVPTDFSVTAQNAAMYAIKLAEQIGAPKVILFNAYQSPMMIDPTAMVPAIQLLDEEQLKADSNKGLERAKLILKAFCPKCCSLETYCEYGLLNNGLDEVCNKLNADLIVMGITGGGALQETLIGSNTLQVSKNSQTPVIIIPAGLVFKKVENVLLASDFKQVLETTPVSSIQSLLKATQARFHIVHIEKSAHISLTDISLESRKLDIMFKDFDPILQLQENNNFLDGINDYVNSNQIDILITIPKKHGILDSLFTRSHTKQIAFHSHVPVMVLHD